MVQYLWLLLLLLWLLLLLLLVLLLQPKEQFLIQDLFSGQCRQKLWYVNPENDLNF